MGPTIKEIAEMQSKSTDWDIIIRLKRRVYKGEVPEILGISCIYPDGLTEEMANIVPDTYIIDYDCANRWVIINCYQEVIK